MMSEPKRLHPVSMAFEAVKTIKDALLPLVIYGFVYLKSWRESDKSFLQNLPMLIALLILVLLLATIVLRWARFTYRTEDRELRIEQGVFVRKKRYVPFERIQSLDFSEGVLHRPFGLVKVKVETAGGSPGKAEAELTAIGKEEALALQELILSAKPNSGDEEAGERETETVLYRITHPQLLFLASTSGRVGVILAAVIGFASQFQDLIPYDLIFQEFEQLVKIGVWFIAAIALLALALGWIVSVLIAYLKYNDFTVRKAEDDFVITRGLLEKRTTTIPIAKVQAVKITESPFRQPFGYAGVSLETAGASGGEDSGDSMLFPVIKKKEIARILQPHLDGYQFDLPVTPVPLRSRRRYFFLKLLITIPLAAGLAYAFFPYGLFALLLIAGALFSGLLQYRSAGTAVEERQLILRYRDFDQQTVWMQKRRIQAMDISVNPFQKRAGLVTVRASVMNGKGGFSAKIKHLDTENAASIYEWYQPEENRSAEPDHPHFTEQQSDKESAGQSE